MPEPAIYEVRATGVKLPAGRNRHRSGRRACYAIAGAGVLRQNANLSSRIRLMLAVQSRLKKYFGFRVCPNHLYKLAAVPPPREGRFAIVTDVGAGCDGRGWRS